jgi:flagellar motor switch protein FliG
MPSSKDGTAPQMATNQPSNIDKAAILLRRLPTSSLTKVLELIGKEKSVVLQQAILSIAKRPDIGELDDMVMQEFREMQQEVKQSLRGSPRLEQAYDQRPAQANSSPPSTSAPITPNSVRAYIEKNYDVGKNSGDSATSDADTTSSAPEKSTEKPTLTTSDLVSELTNTPPAVLAAALQKETLRSTVLVLRELPTECKGKVLELMPAESRQQIFMLLAVRSMVHPAVIQKVLQGIADVCKTIDLSETSKKDERFTNLIGILQMVDREERLRLMEALSEQDEELAAQIDDSLYDYADILRIQDRSVQKLLTQLELKVVALALKTAPQDITDKVMANLSERVRATLTEEMELISSVAPAKVDQARKEIANVIRLQDKDGTLQWIE